MKRSVFILVLSLLGLQSPGSLSPEYTYLTGVIPCDALYVNSSSFSNAKLSIPDKFNFKDQYIINPLGKHQKLPVASINNLVLPEAPTIELASRYFSHRRSKANKYKLLVLNRLNNDIKVPP